MERNLNVTKGRMGQKIARAIGSGELTKYISSMFNGLPINFNNLLNWLRKNGKIEFEGKESVPLEILQMNNFINVASVVSEAAKIDRAKMLAETTKERFEKIVNTYEAFDKIINNNLHEGFEVDTLNLYDHLKSFVENATLALREISTDLHEMFNIAGEIHAEFPDISKDIETTASTMINTLFDYPNQLKSLLQRVGSKYNARRTNGGY